MADKERLDILLVENGTFDSREKAKRAIMSGVVFVDNQRVDKSGTKVLRSANIEVKGKTLPYVSRGGLKLEKAINDFNVSLEGSVCMDIGASTGGFTDCMLQNGAVKVYSVDVGYGQLDWKLRNDPRVVNMERTNIRYVEEDAIEEPLDFVSIDVSFISLKLVLPVANRLLSDEGDIVFLIKPQFEAGREQVKKHGVVRDKKVHYNVICNVLAFAEAEGFNLIELTYSPVKGPKGNIEFLAYATKREVDHKHDIEAIADKIVSKAHEDLL